MCQPDPIIPKSPELALCKSNPNPKKASSSKVMNLPTQVEEQKKRKLGNDQLLLDQL